MRWIYVVWVKWEGESKANWRRKWISYMSWMMKWIQCELKEAWVYDRWDCEYDEICAFHERVERVILSIQRSSFMSFLISSSIFKSTIMTEQTCTVHHEFQEEGSRAREFVRRRREPRDSHDDPEGWVAWRSGGRTICLKCCNQNKTGFINRWNLQSQITH